jgi:hypothetical protein
VLRRYRKSAAPCVYQEAISVDLVSDLQARIATGRQSQLFALAVSGFAAAAFKIAFGLQSALQLVCERREFLLLLRALFFQRVVECVFDR